MADDPNRLATIAIQVRGVCKLTSLQPLTDHLTNVVDITNVTPSKSESVTSSLLSIDVARHPNI